MGLDMYLDASYYIWDFGDTEEGKKGKEIQEKIMSMFPNIGLKPKTIKFRAMYWRKANHIHNWFVENVQDGNDDCGTHYVSREKLQELLDTIEQVLKSTKLIKGKVNNGWSIKNGKRTEHIEDGEIVEDTKVAEELLPTTSGFFFGGTDYDQYYWEELVRTRDELKALLSNKELERFDFDYSSSW